MTTEEIIIHIFCFVDDRLPEIKKHSQAKLYPSELVTLGILFALKGGYFRPFYRYSQKRLHGGGVSGSNSNEILSRSLGACPIGLDCFACSTAINSGVMPC